MRGNKKIVIIVISIIILLLVIIGVTLTLLYIKTDFLKNDRYLFSKYMENNIEVIKELSNTNITNEYQKIKANDKYESKTDINVSYSEGGEVSSPLNDLSMKINSQKDVNEDYNYINAQLLFKEEKYYGLEFLKNKEAYGIRFSDIISQFISIKDDDELENIANDLGIDAKNLQSFINMIDSQEIINSDELTKNTSELVNNYINSLAQEIDSVGTYSHMKKAMITINNETIEANAYSVKLDEEQSKTVIKKILNDLKNDSTVKNIINNSLLDVARKINITNTDLLKKDYYENLIDGLISSVDNNDEFGELTITIYEKDGNTVNTFIEMGVYNIYFNAKKENEKIYFDIQKKLLNNEGEKEQNISILKEKSDSYEKNNITIEFVNGNDKNSLKIENEMKSNNDSLKMATKISNSEGIKNIGVTINDEISTSNNIKKLLNTDEIKVIILNTLEEEERQKILGVLTQGIPKIYREQFEKLQQELGFKEINENPEEENNESNEMSKIEINKFNAKFEYFSNDEATIENIKELLKIVESNLKSASVHKGEDESTEGNQGNNTLEKQKESIKLVIEKDTENKELANKVFERIKEDKKYKIEIEKNNESGLIENIIITEID